MSKTSTWIKVTREDGEIVGYIEPVTENYGTVQPRTVLGHSIGDPCEYVEGEDLLIDHGIAELAERWTLDAGTAAEVSNLTIVELSPHGIVLADYLDSKALTVDKKITIEWPDLHQRLTLSGTQ